MQQLDQVMEKRELIKVRVLETAGLTAREACQTVCGQIGGEPVQCIGTRFVLYRPSQKDPQIVLPK